MTQADARKNSAKFVTIASATPEELPILVNLLELYAHDFSEFHDVDIGPDGRFGYESIPLYWSQPDRHPLLIRIDTHLAGFALVKKGSEFTGRQGVWDMVEFFILRGHRRRRIGTQAAHAVWRKFAGSWEVRVMRSNVAACGFWQKVIARFAGHTVDPISVQKEDKGWQVFSFESKGASQS